MSEDNVEINQEGSRGKVMGILAIVLAGIATFIPFLGVYLTVVAAILAAFSFGKSALLGYIAIGINFLSLFFFSQCCGLPRVQTLLVLLITTLQD